MVSNKDQARKLSRGLRRFSKKFFEDFYAGAEKAGRHPSPLEAVAAFGKVPSRATEEEWPPQPLGQPSVSAEVIESVASRFCQQAYHEAVEAWYRHTPGLEIKKGRPGRKPNVQLAERIQAWRAAGKTNKQIQDLLRAEGLSLSLEGVESYSKSRRRRKP
jgi:hypothetical protein